MEFEVSGNNYRADRLDAKKQFHVARRLTPVLSSLNGASDAEIFASIASALADMPDEQCDYILDTCLGACLRQQGDKWVKVYNDRVKALQFDDIDLTAMLQIAQNVIQENLSGFFGALRRIVGSNLRTTA